MDLSFGIKTSPMRTGYREILDVWQEADGTVWAGYHDVADLAADHGIADRVPTVTAMRDALEAAVKYATAPY